MHLSLAISSVMFQNMTTKGYQLNFSFMTIFRTAIATSARVMCSATSTLSTGTSVIENIFSCEHRKSVRKSCVQVVRSRNEPLGIVHQMIATFFRRGIYEDETIWIAYSFTFFPPHIDHEVFGEPSEIFFTEITIYESIARKDAPIGNY